MRRLLLGLVFVGVLGLLGCGESERPDEAPSLSRAAVTSLLAEGASLSQEQLDVAFRTPPEQWESIPDADRSLLPSLMIVAPKAPWNPGWGEEFRWLGLPSHESTLTALRGPKQSTFEGLTVIHPAYVDDVVIRQQGGVAEGSVSFGAPDLYEGKIDWRARWNGEAWRIESFMLPRRHQRLERNQDGWRLEWFPHVQLPPIEVPTGIEGLDTISHESQTEPVYVTREGRVLTSGGIEDATTDFDQIRERLRSLRRVRGKSDLGLRVAIVADRRAAVARIGSLLDLLARPELRVEQVVLAGRSAPWPSAEGLPVDPRRVDPDGAEGSNEGSLQVRLSPGAAAGSPYFTRIACGSGKRDVWELPIHANDLSAEADGTLASRLGVTFASIKSRLEDLATEEARASATRPVLEVAGEQRVPCGHLLRALTVMRATGLKDARIMTKP